VKKLTENHYLKRHTNKKFQMMAFILLITGLIFLQSGFYSTFFHLLTSSALNPAGLPETADISVSRLIAADTTEAPRTARPTEPAEYSESGSHLETKIQELLDFYDIPGAGAALISAGGVVWTGYFGYADLSEGRAVTADTLFRAESITKSLTAWAVMNLAEKEKLDLDTPALEYLSSWQLPETEYSAEKMTIRQLLSHSSGLTGGSEFEVPEKTRPPLEEVLDGEHGLHQARLVREPGTGFEYSNQGFIILEMIVEEITGQDYEEYFQQEILAPLNIQGYFTIDREIQERLAVSYQLDGGEVPLYTDPFKSAGGLLITTEELARFFAAAFSDCSEEVLTAETRKEMYQPAVETTGFYGLGSDASGLGHFIEYYTRDEQSAEHKKDNAIVNKIEYHKEPGDAGEAAVFHGGEGTGSLSYVYLYPERQEGLILLTNSKRSWPFLAEVLGAWSETRQLPVPAITTVFSRVILGINILTGLLALIALLKIALLIRSVTRGRRYFDPFAVHNTIPRLLNSSGAVLLLLLWWLLGEMLVTNLQPVRYNRLGLAVSLLAVSLLLSALFAPEES